MHILGQRLGHLDFKFPGSLIELLVVDCFDINGNPIGFGVIVQGIDEVIVHGADRSCIGNFCEAISNHTQVQVGNSS